MSKFDQRRLRKTLHKKKTNKQTNRQTNRHYENNGHLAMNQLLLTAVVLACLNEWPAVSTVAQQ